MKLICDKRCIIGEGPIWNEREHRLYYVNGMGDEICMLDLDDLSLSVRPVSPGVSAMALTRMAECLFPDRTACLF